VYSAAAGGLVTSTFLPLVGLLSARCRRGLLAVALLDQPFQVDVNVSFRETEATLGAIGGYSVSPTTAALLGLYASWLIGFLVRDPATPRPRINLPLVCYLGFVALSVFSAYDVQLSQFELFMLVQVFLLQLYVASSVRSLSDFLFIVELLLIGVIGKSLLMIASAGIGHSFAIGPLDVHFENGRAGGTFGSPNSAAGYLALFLAPCIGLVVANVGRRYTVRALIAFAFGSMALILTQSRGAWISFVVSMTVVAIGAWRRGYISLKVPILAAVIAIFLAAPFYGVIITRLTADDQGSGLSRVPLAVLASRVIQDHPVMGIGANNFVLIERQYVTSEFVGDWFYTVHNKYLLVWAETGIGALLAFLWFLVASLRRGWREWTRADPVLSPIALSFTAALLGNMEHMLLDIFNGRALVQALWLISALIVAISNVRMPSHDPS
jgi:O-antigen ligase